MGLFSALTGIFAGGAQKKASQRASDAMIGAYNRGIDTQNDYNKQTRSDYQSYTGAGTAAVGKLSDLTGLNGGDKMAAGLAALKDNPLYSSLFNNGREALLQNASATGGLRGGNFERASMDFGADTLAQVYQQVLSQYGGMTNLGLGAQGAVTQVGGNTANNVTGLQGEIGGARANNFLAKGRINAQNWSNIGSAVDNAVSSFLPMGGGAGLAGAGGGAPAFGFGGGSAGTGGGFSLAKALGSIF